MKLNTVLLILAVSAFITGCLTLLIPYYMDYKQFTLTEMGIVVAASTATTIIMKLISDHVSDKIGVKYPLLIGSFGAIIWVLLIPFARNAGQLTILRLLYGIFVGISSPALGSLVVNIGRKNLGETMGKYTMVVAIANSTLGPFVAGFLGTYLPYNTSFFLLSSLGLIPFVLAFFVPNIKSKTEVRRSNEKFSFDMNIISSSIFQIMALFLVMIMVIYLTVYTSRVYDKKIASIMALIASISFFLSPKFGKLSEKIGELKLISIGFVFYALSFFILKISFSIPILIINALISGLGGTLSAPALHSIGVSGPGKGKRMAIIQSSADLGIFFGSLIGGFMTDSFGFINTFMISGIIGMIVALFAVLLRKRIHL